MRVYCLFSVLVGRRLLVVFHNKLPQTRRGFIVLRGIDMLIDLIGVHRARHIEGKRVKRPQGPQG